MAMTGKRKGQLALVDAFSYMMYFLAVLVIIFLLNIYGCVQKNQQQNNRIDTDVTLASSVRADAQLASMLRTRISPEDLYDRLEWMRNYKEQDFGSGLRIDDSNPFSKDDPFKDVEDFLCLPPKEPGKCPKGSRPELIAGKDYSEFIQDIHVIYTSGSPDKGKAANAFNAVTAALFMRTTIGKIRRGGRVENITWYYLPGVSVKFDTTDMKPGVGQKECLKQGNSYDLCAEYLVETAALPAQMLTHVTQPIPLANSSMAKVGFGYYRETVSNLPKP